MEGTHSTICECNECLEMRRAAGSSASACLLPRFTCGECGCLWCIWWGDGGYVFGFQDRTIAEQMTKALNKQLDQHIAANDKKDATYLLSLMEIAYMQPLPPLALDAVIKAKMFLADKLNANEESRSLSSEQSEGGIG